MPARPERACRVMGCGEALPCPTHQPRRVAGAHHAIYGTKRWRTFRLRILKERPWCEHCLKQGKPRDYLTGRCSDTTSGRTIDVHHIIDLADGGAPFDPGNIEALSKPCHSRVTQQRQRRGAPAQSAPAVAPPHQGEGGPKSWGRVDTHSAGRANTHADDSGEGGVGVSLGPQGESIPLDGRR